MSNREIIMEIVDAFDNNDVERILNCVTDDIEWEMLGENTISGKETLRKFFGEHADMKMVSSTEDHIIINGDSGCVSGSVQCSNGKGQDFNMYYCDIYKLKDDKIKKITTYSINKK
jgi:ketosteroid isomerase-like protein